MKLDTITVDPAEAKTKIKEYETDLSRDRSAEDAAILRGYRQAAKGLPILRLSHVIEAGGFHPNSALPRLAVARADKTRVWVSVPWYTGGPRRGRIEYCTRNWTATRHRLINEHVVEVTGVMLPARDNMDWPTGGSAMVPIVPPDCRPRTRRLGLFHILWEVDEWNLDPPRDPALIRHVGGDLWAVHAVWDLTELERAVLSGTRR